MDVPRIPRVGEGYDDTFSLVPQVEHDDAGDAYKERSRAHLRGLLCDQKLLDQLYHTASTLLRRHSIVGIEPRDLAHGAVVRALSAAKPFDLHSQGKDAKPDGLIRYFTKIMSNLIVDKQRSAVVARSSGEVTNLPAGVLSKKGADDSLPVVWWEDRESSAPTPELIALDRRYMEKFIGAVSKLSPDMGQCIRLRYFDFLTDKEIAKRCGLPLGTVKSNIRRGLEQLERVLGDDFPKELRSSHTPKHKEQH